MKNRNVNYNMFNVTRAILGCLFIVFSLNVKSQDEVYNYKNIPIGAGGYVTEVQYSPVKKNIVYIGTDMGGMYRWDKNKSEWIMLSDGLSSLRYTYVDGIAADPIDSNIVYQACGNNIGAGFTGSILKSTNKGQTWSIIDVPFPMNGNAHVRGLGNRLAIHPSNNKVLYYASRTRGLWKSVDAGVTWLRDTKVPSFGDTLNGVGLTSFIFDKQNPINRYVIVGSLSSDTCFYRTTDYGNTWKPVISPIKSTEKYVIHHASIGSDGNLWCAFGNDYAPFPLSHSKTELRGQVWKYNTKTGIWTNVTPSRLINGVSSPWISYGIYAGVSVDAQNPNHVIVSTNLNYTPDVILGTLDGGKTWNIVAKPPVSWDSNPLNCTIFNTDGARTSNPYSTTSSGNSTTHWMEAIAIDPFNSNNAFFCTGAGVYSSENILEPTFSNIEWTNRWRGIEQSVALDLTASVNGALFSCLGDISGMRHFNLDQPLRSTQGFYTNPGAAHTKSLDYAGKNPNIVVRSANDLIGISLDNGLTWNPTVSNPVGAHGDVAISALGSHIVYSNHNSTTDVSAYYSDNKGSTWLKCIFYNGTTLVANTKAAQVAADRVNDKLFFAVLSSEIYISTDGGHTFYKKSNLTSGTGIYQTVTTGMPRAVFGQEGEFWAMDNNSAVNVGAPSKALMRFIWKNGKLTFEKKAKATWSYGWPKYTEGACGISSIGFGKPAPGKQYPSIFILGTVYDSNYKSRGYGLYRSDDIGTSWIRINTNDQYFVNPQFVAGDENVYGRIYLATNGRGLLYGESSNTFTDACGHTVGGNTNVDACSQMAQGVYKISPVNNLAYCLVSGSTSLLQSTCTNSVSQDWTFVQSSNNGSYYIKNNATNKYLSYVSLTSGSRLNAFSNTPTEWRVEYAGVIENGIPMYRISTTENPDLVLLNKTATAYNLFLGTRINSDNQRFVLNYVRASTARQIDQTEDLTILDDSKVICYPNPFESEFLIQCEGDFNYSIYSLSGQEILKGNGVNQVSLGQELKSGMYIVKIYSNNSEKAFKLIKQK